LRGVAPLDVIVMVVVDTAAPPSPPLGELGLEPPLQPATDAIRTTMPATGRIRRTSSRC
jgi:hypothetical protein